MVRRPYLLAGLAALIIAAAGSPLQARTGSEMLGRIDTIGGTTYDFQVLGPEPAWVYYDSGYGIHVAWMYSTDGTPFPDRNLRYNFHDDVVGTWNWIDPDYMQSGINIFPERTGFGSFDVDPVTHCAYLVAHAGSPIHPVMARDAEPGSGVFDYCAGDSGQWPRLAIGHAGKPHVAMFQNGLYYSAVDPWGTWLTPYHIPPPLPDPSGPAYAIAASKSRPEVCIAWIAVDSEPRYVYSRRSSDDGVTWLPPDTLSIPPAFHPGSDTSASVSIDGLFPWYDPDDEENDDLGMVAAVYPVVQGQGQIVPVELWSWKRTAGWIRIARAECDTAHMAGGVGTNSLFASRPTIGRCAATHQLVCVWEQFDSLNVEPRTGLLRADIWAARGDSLGSNWGKPVRLTAPDTTSKRFPSVAGWTDGDTFVVSYEIDLCAGFATNMEGPATYNPIAVQRVDIESLPAPDAGITERGSRTASKWSVHATVARGLLNLQSATCNLQVEVALLDIAGRHVLNLLPGANDVSHLAPGVYFVREAQAQAHVQAACKVVLTR